MWTNITCPRCATAPGAGRRSAALPVLPHMTLAGWDLLELIMEAKARDYPQWFS
jgi:hypothetical protein